MGAHQALPSCFQGLDVGAFRGSEVLLVGEGWSQGDNEQIDCDSRCFKVKQYFQADRSK